MHGNLVVPNLWCIIHFTANIVPLLNDGIELSSEEVSTIDFLHSYGKAEISDDDFTFTIDQEVLWLDVSMYNAMTMQVMHALHELLEDVSGNTFIKPFGMLDKTIQLTELSKFHYIITDLSFAFEDDPLLLILMLIAQYLRFV